MTYAAGVMLGIVVGFGIAAFVARRTPGGSRLASRRNTFVAVVAVALVAISFVLTRQDHRGGNRRPPVPSTTVSVTTSTGAPETTTTTPAPAARAIVTVPNLLGRTRAAALAALKNLLLHAKIQTLPSASVPPDFVLSQNPVTESLVPVGSTVSLVISAAP